MRAESGVSTRVLFVRHGNVHNPANLIYGRLPRMRLSSRGHDEMERTAELLAHEPIAAIYTSPLLRARQSAEHIARRHPGVPVRVCSWLIEVRTSWEGESNRIVGETPGFSYYDPLKGEGDETIQDVFDRMDRAVRMVLRRHDGQTSVCVSHGDPIKIVRTGYSGRPLTPTWVRAPDPGQASIVEFHFWRPGALPIIDAHDPSIVERLIRGEHVDAAVKRLAEKAAKAEEGTDTVPSS
jgi:broad specificity phosphatase PhoE